MVTTKQMEILKIMAEKPLKEYSFKEIKNNNKSNSIIQNSIKTFLEENLIKEKSIGNQKIYSLNYENHLLHNIIEINNKKQLPKTVRLSVDILIEELNKSLTFDSLVLFGSYAKNKNKKDSDLDVAIIIPSKDFEKNAKIALNSAKNKALLEIDGQIITEGDFLEMLKVDYENLGKEIARNHLPIYNSSIFFNILNKGVKNGFKIVY